MLSFIQEQPTGFRSICKIELFNRLSICTVLGFLVSYGSLSINHSIPNIQLLATAFIGLLCITTCIGGYIGDQILGTKRAMALGLTTAAVGYFILLLAKGSQFYFGLGLICIGNGLFATIPPNRLSKEYKKNDYRLYSGFTLYYTFIESSAIIAFFIGQRLSSYSSAPYMYSFALITTLACLYNVCKLDKQATHVHSPADNQTVSYWRWGILIACILLTAFASYFLFLYISLVNTLLWFIAVMLIAVYLGYLRLIYLTYLQWQKKETSFKPMLIALILIIEGFIFYLLYQGMSDFLDSFTLTYVRRTLFGISSTPLQFHPLYLFWLIILAPFFALMYKVLNRKYLGFSFTALFSIGTICCGIGFTLLFFSRFIHDTQGMISSGWLVASYFFQCAGELIISGIGLAMIAQLVPSTMTGFMMSMWLLTSAIGRFFAITFLTTAHINAALAAFLHKASIPSLNLYTHNFAYMGFTTVLIGLLMLCISTGIHYTLSGRYKKTVGSSAI